MNALEPALAFAEGLALIASPCILPVLPLVLSASSEGGRGRPYGIITGFILSFSAFALLSRKLITALGIDLDYIRDGSLILLALFGLVLLSGKLSEKFSALTQGAANVGTKLSANTSGGFGSGVGIGALIGLVWTPCAGPILAAVLVQVIRQQSDVAGLVIILCFAIGASVPMLAIALLGRRVMGRLGFFTTHAEAVRKTFGVIILLAVAFIASGADVNTLFTRDTTSVTLEAKSLKDPLDTPYLAPDFKGVSHWLNTEPLTMTDLKGKVVLVDFWTYSCINCVRTFPYLTAWDAKYRAAGLVIVGVHSPEFEFEKNVDNVRAALKEHGITYPVAMDNELATWLSFENKFWPAHYLIDRAGNVVYRHYGEGNYDVTENNIRFLLGLTEKAQSVVPAGAVFSMDQTPETYLGYKRAARNEMPLSTNQTHHYDGPRELPLHGWSLSGKWESTPERIISAEKGATLRLHFKAGKVFLVMGSKSGENIDAAISLNGNAVQVIHVRQNTLYELVAQPDVREGTVEIMAGAPGLEAYAFTFGN